MNLTHEAVTRCLALIPLIREHQGISLDELSRLARIPKEQIANELGGLLLMCGVPPYFPHDYIGFLLDGERVEIRFANHFQRPISLNPIEALALRIACESMTPPGKTIPRVIATLLRKVESAMSPEQRRQFANLSRRLLVTEPEDAALGLTGRIALSIAERRAIRIEYLALGRDTIKEREVLPYGLIGRDGHWYLVGQDAARGKIVTFRLDRIRRLRVEDRHFEIEPGFRLEDYAKAALVPDDDDRPRATIRFRGPSARWLRETAAAGTLTEEPGGVVWSPPIASEEGLARFILGFGADAVVLSPPSLRARVVESLRAAWSAHLPLEAAS